MHWGTQVPSCPRFIIHQYKKIHQATIVTESVCTLSPPPVGVTSPLLLSGVTPASDLTSPNSSISCVTISTRCSAAAGFGSGESGPSLLAPLMLPLLSSRLGVQLVLPMLRGGERPVSDTDPIEEILPKRTTRRLPPLRVGAGV